MMFLSFITLLLYLYAFTMDTKVKAIF